MTTALATLLDRWSTDIGKPYKGKLIDLDAYNADPANLGCMDAQGQVLHYIGGWTPERLSDVSQSIADAETAKLLHISRTHAVLLRTVNDRSDGAPAIVLTDPGQVLGDQWSKLLDFWLHIDGMTDGQWDAALAAMDAARAASSASSAALAARTAALAAGDAAGAASSAALAAWVAAWDAAGVAARASNEIQGAAIMRGKGQPLYFLPFFGFASPDDIPARPENYGQIGGAA